MIRHNVSYENLANPKKRMGIADRTLVQSTMVLNTHLQRVVAFLHEKDMKAPEARHRSCFTGERRKADMLTGLLSPVSMKVICHRY